MTSFHPPLPVPDDDPLDAAASAVVDGVATPEETAVVAAAADGAERVARLRGVADAVGSPVGDQEPGEAAAALGAALAAATAPPERAVPAGEGPPADEHRPPRGTETVRVLAGPAPRTRRGLSRYAAVAAALVVLLGIGVLAVAVITSSGDGTTSTASAPTRRTLDQGASLAAPASPVPGSGGASTLADPARRGASAPLVPGAPAAGGGDSGHAQPFPAAPPPPVDGGDLGGQADLDALTQRVDAALAGVPEAGLTTPNTALPSDVQACVTAGPSLAGEIVGALRYRAVGAFSGTDAVFLAYDRPAAPPARRLLVLARNSCTPLASRPF